MTVKDQLKILDNKIRQNQADYDLCRKNAKISALSSGKLDKYEYLTGEDLGYRPDPVQKAKFQHSPLGQVFNKGLDKNEKSECLLKRLKNIEDKTDNQLDLIRDQENKQLGKIEEVLSNKKVVSFYDGVDDEIKNLVDRTKDETIKNLTDEKKVF